MGKNQLAALTALSCLFLGACVSRIPLALPSNSAVVLLKPVDIAIKGPTQGTSSAPIFLGMVLGANSFHEAEQAALSANNSDILLGRYSYIGREGLGFGNFFLFGVQKYYIQGVGVQVSD